MTAFFENSRQAGRIVALISVLIICGTLSIMSIVHNPDTTGDLVEKWLYVLGPISAFYFAGTQQKKE